MPGDAEPLVARRVARGDQHVVDAGRVVGLEGEDRPPAVRHEVLAGPREQAVDVDARVLRAGVLADVGRDEGEQVAALVALEVDDAEPPPAQQAHRAALPGRDHHPPLDFQRRLARHAAPPRVALPMRVGNQCPRRRATGGPGELGAGTLEVPPAPVGSRDRAHDRRSRRGHGARAHAPRLHARAGDGRPLALRDRVARPVAVPARGRPRRDERALAAPAVGLAAVRRPPRRARGERARVRPGGADRARRPRTSSRPAGRRACRSSSSPTRTRSRPSPRRSRTGAPRTAGAGWTTRCAARRRCWTRSRAARGRAASSTCCAVTTASRPSPWTRRGSSSPRVRAAASSPPRRGPRRPGTPPATSRSPSRSRTGATRARSASRPATASTATSSARAHRRRSTHDALEALDQARRFLAVELDRQEEVHRERVRFASELIDLVEAGEARPVETAARLERFGLELRAGVTVLAVALDPPAGDATTVARAIEAAGAGGRPALVATRGEEIVAVVPAEPMSTGAGEPDALRTAVERATGSAARVGIGSRADAAGALQRSLAEARHALRLASAERPVVRWDMLAGHRLLMDLQPPEIADAFERTLLAPLDEHDARRGTDLVRTVEVFLDAAGHWKPAADVLHVHVNTLRHRLDRVAALTGRDLAQMGDRVDFYLALQVRRSRAGRALTPRLEDRPSPRRAVLRFGQWARPPASGWLSATGDGLPPHRGPPPLPERPRRRRGRRRGRPGRPGPHRGGRHRRAPRGGAPGSGPRRPRRRLAPARPPQRPRSRRGLAARRAARGVPARALRRRGRAAHVRPHARHRRGPDPLGRRAHPPPALRRRRGRRDPRVPRRRPARRVLPRGARPVFRPPLRRRRPPPPRRAPARPRRRGAPPAARGSRPSPSRATSSAGARCGDRWSGDEGVEVVLGPDNPQWCTDDCLLALREVGCPAAPALPGDRRPARVRARRGRRVAGRAPRAPGDPRAGRDPRPPDPRVGRRHRGGGRGGGAGRLEPGLEPAPRERRHPRPRPRRGGRPARPRRRRRRVRRRRGPARRGPPRRAPAAGRGHRRAAAREPGRARDGGRAPRTGRCRPTSWRWLPSGPATPSTRSCGARAPATCVRCTRAASRCCTDGVLRRIADDPPDPAPNGPAPGAALAARLDPFVRRALAAARPRMDAATRG